MTRDEVMAVIMSEPDCPLFDMVSRECIAAFVMYCVIDPTSALQVTHNDFHWFAAGYESSEVIHSRPPPNDRRN